VQVQHYQSVYKDALRNEELLSVQLAKDRGKMEAMEKQLAEVHGAMGDIPWHTHLLAPSVL
jgi:hypothetical protein